MFELKPIPLCHPAGVSTPGAPTGVVTFLFTDIEGSTRRWEAETGLAGVLARVEAEYGDPVAALDYVTATIRNYHDAGNNPAIRVALAILVSLLDRLGRYEPAAIIAGFALSPLTATGLSWFTAAMAHLHEVLGSEAYDPLAQKGKSMTTAEMARYAYEQIDQARTELEHK